MAQFDVAARALGKKGSMAQRLKSARRAIYLVVLAALLWSTESAAQAVPASCPSNLATADIISHDFTVSFCELCDVMHTGQMAGNSVAGRKIWFTNGSSTSIRGGCQNYLIPVEKIDKRNPADTTTAAIGLPSKYTVTPTFYNTGSLVTFDSFPMVPAGEQIILEIAAVLDDPSANSPSTQFVNAAAWDFGAYEAATQ